MYRAHDSVLSYQKQDYAAHIPADCMLDCSLAVNPAPVPRSVLEKLRTLDEDVLKPYPWQDELYDLLAAHWSSVAQVERKQFVLGCGSFDLLANIDLLFLGRGRKALCFSPQFPALVDHMQAIGTELCLCRGEKERNYRFDVDAFLALLHSGIDHILLENPNNPTGQIIPLEAIKNIAAAAKKMGIAMTVDEAYGDYIPMEHSAITLLPLFDNLLVTRSFSKGLGLAGMRLGYAVASKEMAALLGKLTTPFSANAIARELAAAFLKSEARLPRIEALREKKELLRMRVKKLHAAHTDDETPILTLYCDDPKVDLQALLHSVGIASVSGKSYQTLEKNAVRLMVHQNIELLLHLLEKAEQSL